MLLNNLYTLSSVELSEAMDRISAQVVLNAEHPLFSGHFPGNPILPGVCTVQIIREILENATGKEFMLTRADSIKYQGFISPVTTPEIHFDLAIKHIESTKTSCSATVSAAGNKLCNFRGEYVVM